jgi:hypothetical protein
VRKVRCVSPHGGCHDGVRADNGMPARPGYKGALSYPPNPRTGTGLTPGEGGGYVDNAILGRVAVGSEVDAPDDFEPGGFHFVWADDDPPAVAEAPPVTIPADPAEPEE